MVLRALGPSLTGFAFPVCSTIRFSESMILLALSLQTNDNWQSESKPLDNRSHGLAPAILLESATVQTLAPGAYTVIRYWKGLCQGIALVEL